ncbi:MAG: ABC transporter permease subunit [Chloroflexota bacterium]
MLSFWSGKRGRDLREYLTAYLMITPAMLLIFVFGIFPVIFAVYVSLHKWKIKQGPFLGLENYVKAIDALTYVLFFALVVGLVYFAYRRIRDCVVQAQEHNEKPWALLVPGMLNAGGILLILRYVFLLIPEVLAIADKVRGQERSRELFLQLLGEALRADHVVSAFWNWVCLLALALVLTLILWRFIRTPHRVTYLNQMTVAWSCLVGAVIVGWFTYTEMVKAIHAAMETGEGNLVSVQVVLISTGVLCLGVAWKFWSKAVKHESDRAFIWRGFVALLLIVGGWLLVGEIPAVIQSGDKNVWQGLKVTVFYAAGTIPFQLSIALVLAYLLFQNVRGRDFFRVVYFLPYVTPAVASAAVFRLMFGPRASSPVNALITLLGGEHQRWLIEPRGVFTILGSYLGVEVPSWAAGPSLALVVIIIFSIWTYVGYDTVIYLAGLGNISHEINEAAAIDGASRWQIFRYITLPLLSPTTYFLSLIAVIGTFKAFNHIYVMRDVMALGTVDTVSVAIFDEFFLRTRFGYASAMAFVLFAIILVLTYANNKIQGSRVFYG